VDGDFPANKVKTWVQAVTGAELDKNTHEVKILEQGEWHKVRIDYDRIAKEHMEHHE
jgi:hypothetical protein